ncbi:hypothetical protein DAMNIGENAA_08880 [Desulforhabdus amnigena]|uniref:Queuosine 5'-phosphate N-glycosylase/hydrolase n=1 Tax=Desulforhabdus amnigena TaxID=40218 RepID=A0A9W6FTB3_9BACT|nr:hypothetical protein DAMNIGENAA_08880 [Desulforhabdus amnigena]
MAASLKRAQESGIPITQPDFLANLSADDLKGILSGNVEIPLFEERLFNLREAGRILNSTWRGDIIHLLESAKGNALVAVKKIVDSFPSFRDDARYGEIEVYFWKRAQIFISDVNLAFAGRKWGKFIHMDKLTAFADYKLPQVLRALGVISYHPDLASKVDSMQVLSQGCEEEIEIRAMTVWAVEALKNAFAAQGREVSSTWVDNWLWQLGQMESFRKRPYHRCRTIFY